MDFDPDTPPSARFHDLLGVEVVAATPERVEMALQLRPDHHQPYGIAHGGVYCTLAESAASFGAVYARGGLPAVGLSNHTDFLRATSEGTLTAVATPLHVGRSSQLWEVRITDDEGRLCAQSKVRMFNMDATG